MTVLEALAKGLKGMQLLEELSLDFRYSKLRSLEGFEDLAGLRRLQKCFMDLSWTQIGDVQASRTSSHSMLLGTPARVQRLLL